MRSNLIEFVEALHMKNNIEFSNVNFENFDFSYLSSDDLVYCDPPYLITEAPYNSVGTNKWSEKYDKKLYELLDNLNSKNIKFALSNVIMTKGKTNNVLKEWLSVNNYNVHKINSNYSNSFANRLDRNNNLTHEVLITNYSVKENKTNKNFFELL